MLMFGEDYNIKDVRFGEDYKINYIYFGDNLVWERKTNNSVPAEANAMVMYKYDTFQIFNDMARYSIEKIWINGVEEDNINPYINVKTSDMVYFKFTDNVIPSFWLQDTEAKDITLYDNIEGINDSAFSNIRNLETITCYATEPLNVNPYTFEGINYTGTIYYPCGSDYSSWEMLLSNWSFVCKDIAQATVTATFYFSNSLADNKLPILNEDSLKYVKKIKVNGTEIPLEAYYAYSSINTEYVVEYTLIDGTTIPESFLENISRFTAITIGNSVINIGSSAFRNCDITSVTIPNSVTTINDGAFMDCYDLTDITMGYYVSSIGDRAFRNCKSLTSITCNATKAPTISKETFFAIPNEGVLNYPCGSDYEKWMSADAYYLGYYKWTSKCFENWQQMSKGMDKTIPFQTIRINTNGADASGWYFINFSTEKNQTNNGASTQYSVAIEENHLWDDHIKHNISELTKIDEGVYEYTFSTPLYYAGCEENAQPSLISYLPI